MVTRSSGHVVRLTHHPGGEFTLFQICPYIRLSAYVLWIKKGNLSILKTDFIPILDS